MTKYLKIFLDLEKNADNQSEHKYSGRNFCLEESVKFLGISQIKIIL